MKIKSKRLLTVLLTLLFSVTVFTVTAFAESITGTVAPEPPSSASEQQPSAPASSVASEPPSSTERVSSAASEPPSSAEPASRKPPEAASSRRTNPSSRSAASSKRVYVDTQTSRVEAVASQADAALSDPGVLSSENWGELLSSGSQSQTDAVGTVSSSVSSTAGTPNVGGVSSILILGVVLIVLALCGIGLFIYLQFFSDRGSIGPKTYFESVPKNTDEPSQEDTLTFTDISSDSSGENTPAAPPALESSDIHSSSTPITPTVKPQRKPPAPNAKKSNALPGKSAPKKTDDTAPIEVPELPKRKPVVPSAGTEPLSKSQATPVSKSSDFDWEKFFNDQK